VIFFFALVAAIQLVEHLYLWYVHREDRVLLEELREDLVDRGALMIEAQLEVARIRSDIEAVDSGTPHPRPRLGTPLAVAVRSDEARATLGRNQLLVELKDAVNRRNSAAVDYHVLADSIRSVAERARDPYFAIPLPAEAATARGIRPAVRDDGADRGASSSPATGTARSTLRAAVH
jgi:hypothetical protein